MLEGGGEYVNKQFTNMFTEAGILHQVSCPYTPLKMELLKVNIGT